MNQRAVFLAGTIFVLIVIGLFVFAYFAVQKQKISEVVTPAVERREDRTDPVRITGLHVFKDGTHSVLGELQVSNTCTLVNAETATGATSPGTTIVLTSIESTGSLCEQKTSSQRFLVSFKGPEDATITATFNGNPAILNLVEGDPSKALKIDDEFFIKG